VNARWLLLGEGEMYGHVETHVYPTEKHAAPIDRAEEPPSQYSTDADCLREKITYLQRALQDKEEIITLLRERK